MECQCCVDGGYELACGLCGGPCVCPKALPCLHSFCHLCLARHLAQDAHAQSRHSFSCPVCGRVVVPRDASRKAAKWADDLPTNIYLMALLHVMDELCFCCHNQASLWCRTCAEAFCANCGDYHLRMPNQDTHVMVQLDSTSAKMRDRDRSHTKTNLGHLASRYSLSNNGSRPSVYMRSLQKLEQSGCRYDRPPVASSKQEKGQGETEKRVARELLTCACCKRNDSNEKAKLWCQDCALAFCTECGPAHGCPASSSSSDSDQVAASVSVSLEVEGEDCNRTSDMLKTFISEGCRAAMNVVSGLQGICSDRGRSVERRRRGGARSRSSARHPSHSTSSECVPSLTTCPACRRAMDRPQKRVSITDDGTQRARATSFSVRNDKVSKCKVCGCKILAQSEPFKVHQVNRELSPINSTRALSSHSVIEGPSIVDISRGDLAKLSSRGDRGSVASNAVKQVDGSAQPSYTLLSKLDSKGRDAWEEANRASFHSTRPMEEKSSMLSNSGDLLAGRGVAQQTSLASKPSCRDKSTMCPCPCRYVDAQQQTRSRRSSPTSRATREPRKHFAGCEDELCKCVQVSTIDPTGPFEATSANVSGRYCCDHCPLCRAKILDKHSNDRSAQVGEESSSRPAAHQDVMCDCQEPMVFDSGFCIYFVNGPPPCSECRDHSDRLCQDASICSLCNRTVCTQCETCMCEKASATDPNYCICFDKNASPDDLGADDLDESCPGHFSRCSPENKEKVSQGHGTQRAATDCVMCDHAGTYRPVAMCSERFEVYATSRVAVQSRSLLCTCSLCRPCSCVSCRRLGLRIGGVGSGNQYLRLCTCGSSCTLLQMGASYYTMVRAGTYSCLTMSVCSRGSSCSFLKARSAYNQAQDHRPCRCCSSCPSKRQSAPPQSILKQHTDSTILEVFNTPSASSEQRDQEPSGYEQPNSGSLSETEEQLLHEEYFDQDKQPMPDEPPILPVERMNEQSSIDAQPPFDEGQVRDRAQVSPKQSPPSPPTTRKVSYSPPEPEQDSPASQYRGGEQSSRRQTPPNSPVSEKRSDFPRAFTEPDNQLGNQKNLNPEPTVLPVFSDPGFRSSKGSLVNNAQSVPTFITQEASTSHYTVHSPTLQSLEYDDDKGSPANDHPSSVKSGPNTSPEERPKPPTPRVVLGQQHDKKTPIQWAVTAGPPLQPPMEPSKQIYGDGPPGQVQYQPGTQPLYPVSPMVPPDDGRDQSRFQPAAQNVAPPAMTSPALRQIASPTQPSGDQRQLPPQDRSYPATPATASPVMQAPPQTGKMEQPGGMQGYPQSEQPVTRPMPPTSGIQKFADERYKDQRVPGQQQPQTGMDEGHDRQGVLDQQLPPSGIGRGDDKERGLGQQQAQVVTNEGYNDQRGRVQQEPPNGIRQGYDKQEVSGQQQPQTGMGQGYNEQEVGRGHDEQGGRGQQQSYSTGARGIFKQNLPDGRKDALPGVSESVSQPSPSTGTGTEVEGPSRPKYAESPLLRQDDAAPSARPWGQQSGEVNMPPAFPPSVVATGALGRGWDQVPPVTTEQSRAAPPIAALSDLKSFREELAYFGPTPQVPLRFYPGARDRRVEREGLSPLCGLCFGPVNQPKALPCLHTFCQECLQAFVSRDPEASVRGAILCPLCSRPAVPPNLSLSQEKWAASFPTNVFLEALLGAMQTNVGCNCCKGGQQAWCRECGAIYCSLCGRNHGMHHALANLCSVTKAQGQYDKKLRVSKGLGKKKAPRPPGLDTKDLLQPKDGLSNAQLRDEDCPLCLGTMVTSQNHPCLHGTCTACLKTLESEKEMQEATQALLCPMCLNYSVIPPGTFEYNTIHRLLLNTVTCDCHVAEAEQVLCFRCQQPICKLCGHFPHPDTVPVVEHGMPGATEHDVHTGEHLRSKQDARKIVLYNKLRQWQLQPQPQFSHLMQPSQLLLQLPPQELPHPQELPQSQQLPANQTETAGGHASHMNMQGYNVQDDFMCRLCRRNEVDPEKPGVKRGHAPIPHKIINAGMRGDTEAAMLRDICVLCSHVVVATDWRNQCVKAWGRPRDGSQAMASRVQLESPPHGVAEMDDCSLVVSMPDVRRIVFLNVRDSGKLERRFTVTTVRKCYGMAGLSGGRVAATCPWDKVVDILGRHGELLETVRTCKVPDSLVFWPEYICRVPNDELVLSDLGYQQITCVSIDGRLRWTSESGKVKEPLGITADSVGQFYVADGATGSVWRMATGGQDLQRLLWSAYGLKKPRSVAWRDGFLYVGDSTFIKVFNASDVGVGIPFVH